MTKTCYYCSNIEHEDTVGILSVIPKYEGKWFCSTNCLIIHKQYGLREKKKIKKKN